MKMTMIPKEAGDVVLLPCKARYRENSKTAEYFGDWIYL